jgi:hypothetical protein
MAAHKKNRTYLDWIWLYIQFFGGILVFELLALIAFMVAGIWSLGIFVLVSAGIITQALLRQEIKQNPAQWLATCSIIVALASFTLWSGYINKAFGGSAVAFTALIALILWRMFLDQKAVTR